MLFTDTSDVKQVKWVLLYTA